MDSSKLIILLFMNVFFIAFLQMGLRSVFCPLSTIEVWAMCGEQMLLPSLMIAVGSNIYLFKKASKLEKKTKGGFVKRLGRCRCCLVEDPDSVHEHDPNVMRATKKKELKQ